MRRQMTTLNVAIEDFTAIVALKNTRPQDNSRADTFHYLLQFHKEMQEFKPRPQDANNADTMAYLIQLHKEMQEFKPRPHAKVEQVHSKIIVAGEDTP